MKKYRYYTAQKTKPNEPKTNPIKPKRTQFKPNSQKGKNEHKLLLHKGLQKKPRRMAKKNKPNSNPKPARLKLPWAVNRILKNAVLGAAQTAINQKDNAFKDYCERMVENGIIPSNARHAVARKLLTVIWAMWKTNSSLAPSHIGGWQRLYDCPKIFRLFITSKIALRKA